MSVMQQITDIKNDSPTLVKGKVSSVWGIKNILAMTDDDEEEDDEVMANNGPCADMSKRCLKSNLHVQQNQAQRRTLLIQYQSISMTLGLKSCLIY